MPRMKRGIPVNKIGQPVLDWVGPGDYVVFPGDLERKVECLVWLDGAPAALCEKRENDLFVSDRTYPISELYARVHDLGIWKIRRAAA